MTNKEYLQKELPLWLFNKIVPNSWTNAEFTSIRTGRDAFDWFDTKEAAKILDVTFGKWKDQEETMADIFKCLWSQNKDFLFPCTVEEALSILKLVEPEFYEFLMARKRNPRLISTATEWFGEHGVFSLLIQFWHNTADGISYWANKKDFSLSAQWIAEQTVVAKPEPKTIGEWLDLPENSLIKEIAEFDHSIHDRQHVLSEKLVQNLNDLFFVLPGTDTGVYSECRSVKSFQPYIDWYNNHPKNPKNVTPTVALKDVREEHSLEWWRDELAKTEPKVAAYLYGEYVKQNRLNRTPRMLFGNDSESFLGGISWSSAEFGHTIHSVCYVEESFQPLKEALAAREASAKATVIVDSVSSEMPGAIFPCTIQERIDWMLTQPKLKPIAEFIVKNGGYRGSRDVHGEFINSQGDSFAYWCSSQNIIEQDCNKAKSWEPFFTKYPNLRAKTPKPVELKKINEHRQLLVECANIKEVKLLLKHVNQESAFTHSERLVIFYDLDEKKIYHVGNTKKSQWKQIPNKVHKKVSVEQFLVEVPMVNLAADRKPRLGASERKVTVTEINKTSVQKSSWFDDVPVETKKPINWFD